MDISEIMSAKSAAVVECVIQLDGEASQRIDTLREEIRLAERQDMRENRNPVAPGLKDKLREMVDAAKKSQAVFVFKSIGRVEWDNLVITHPPTEENKEIEKTAAWNLDTFPPALIALSCQDPVMTLEQATALWENDDWSGNELTRLFSTAWAVNQEQPSIPFDRLGIELMETTEPNSDGAVTEESLEASF